MKKTTALVGDVVAASNYTADFSVTLTESKERLVNPISRIIESYVIKDLRSVETVNEQFVEKINDKLENASITSREEKDAFTNNLNNLLNEKYLEIVKIKRVDFVDESGTNADIEQTINDFKAYLDSVATFEEYRLNELFNMYMEELYSLVSTSIKQVSDLYLNNFVGEVSASLNSIIDLDNDSIYNNEQEDNFKPFIPEINPMPEVDIPVIPSIPDVNEESFASEEAPVEAEIPMISEIDRLPEIEEIPIEGSEEANEVPLFNIEPIAPIEIKEEQYEAPKRSYDVEEILKIAKSPIVAMPEEKESNDDLYINVEPIVSEKESETMDSEFNEREIVEEMISRLTKRLQAIDERRAKYEEEKSKLEEDEAFVNNLIESSNIKKTELDRFEQELNDKEKELADKQRELDKKINDVMPFANAVLNSEKES